MHKAISFIMYPSANTLIITFLLYASEDYFLSKR